MCSISSFRSQFKYFVFIFISRLFIISLFGSNLATYSCYITKTKTQRLWPASVHGISKDHLGIKPSKEINGIPFKWCLFCLTLSLKLMQEFLENFKLWHFTDRLIWESMEDFKPLNTIFLRYVRHIPFFKDFSSLFAKSVKKKQHCSVKSLILENPISGFKIFLGILMQVLFSHHYHDVINYNIPTD